MSDKEAYLSPSQAPQVNELIYTDHYKGIEHKEAYSLLTAKQIEIVTLNEPPF